MKSTSDQPALRLLAHFLSLLAIILILTSEADAAIKCYECHGTTIDIFTGDYRPVDANGRDAATGGFKGNHRTHMAQTTNAAACAKCHPGSASYQPSHRDGHVKVSARLNNSPITTTYNNSTSAWHQTINPDLGTCTNVNCHFETATPVWGSSPFSTPADCNKCHGVPPAGIAPSYSGGTAGSHAKHNSYYNGLTNCSKCHIDHTSESKPFAHASSIGRRSLEIHLRDPKDYLCGRYTSATNGNYLPSETGSHTFGSCIYAYCHSPGTQANFAFVTLPNKNAQWGGSLDCTGCHKSDPASNDTMDTGSHTSHMYKLYNCTRCHSASVTGAMTIKDLSLHVNKRIDIAFDGTSSASAGFYNTSSALPSKPYAKRPGTDYAICSATYCHSTGQGDGGTWPPHYENPVWGSNPTGKCGTCHGVTGSMFHGGFPFPVQRRISSGSHNRHLMGYTLGITDNDIRCAICHAYDKSQFVSSGSSCTNICHNGTPADLSVRKHANFAVDVNIANYFGATANYNGTTRPGDGYSSCSNTYCHSSAISLSTGTVPANTSPAWGSGAMACNGCHGNLTYNDSRKAFPLYTTNRSATKANSHKPHLAYSCDKCHYDTTTNGTTITGPTAHVDKQYSVKNGSGVTFTYAFNTAGGTCSTISCHGTGNAQWGKTGCLDCHSVVQGKRAAVSWHFYGYSHHVQGTVSDSSCYQCHWEANSDGSINQTWHNATVSGAAVRLVVYSTMQRPKDSSRYFIAYTANGKRAQIQKISTHCMGCHSDQNNTAQPFGDGKTPKQYSWDGTSIAARYSQSGTTSWGKYTSVSYTNTAKKKINKAFSAHANAGDNQRGWNSTTGVDGAITDTSGAVGVQCYDCHNSHGSYIAGITSRYSSATGRQKGGILKKTTRGYGGYSSTYKPAAAGSTATKDVRSPGASLCLDCHFSSTTKQAPLAAFKGYTTPWGYSSTFGASQAISGYWDSPFMGYTTAGPEQRYSFKKSFSFKGGHFGSSSPLNVQPSSANQINGLCTPCHDPHGVSPSLEANQKYAVPLLKGTWLTSPYKEDTAPSNKALFTARTEGVPYKIDQNTFGSGLINSVTGITETTGDTSEDSQSAGLCLGCHSKASLTDGVTHNWKNKNRIHESVKGWKTANGTIKHNYSCSKCHGAHSSSVLPRLMVTNCLDSQHKGRSSWTSPALGASGAGGFSWCEVPVPNKNELCWNYIGDRKYNGSGTGRIPGSWRGDKPGFGNNSVACHEGQTGSGTDQSWNTVTPWGIYPPISIASGPTTSLTGLQANVTWATNIPSDSSVSYGMTTGYGSTVTAAPAVMNHTVTLPGLTNHSTYHYQATSLASDAQQVVSPDTTFYVSVPPSVPSLIAQPSSSACADSCSQTLQWNASTDPDTGPIQYEVQVSSNSDFSSLVYDSGWISGTSATTGGLATNATYWWRVRARDGDHITAQDPTSGWSSTSSYGLSSILTNAPTIGVPSNTATTSIRWNFTDNAFNEDGFKLHDSSNNIKTSLASPNLSYLDETGLTANTQYTRHVHAYNAAGGDSGPSADASGYTLPLPPNVTANRETSTWYTTAGTTFTFGNAAGFGSGGVQYYRYAWNQNSSHTFDDTESQWSSGTLTLTPSAEGIWYLHVKSYNAEHTANSTQYYGPFQYDATAPTGLADNRSPANMAMNQPTNATLNALAADSASGSVEYWFQIATDIGFSYDVQNSGWQASTSFAPTLSLGPTYYWRVKARDGAHNETAYTNTWKFTTAPYAADWTVRGDFENNASTTGTATNRTNVKVAGGSNSTDNAAVISIFKYIVSGYSKALAVRPDGSVWAWNTTYAGGASQVTGLGAGSGVISLAVGSSHSLALKSDGSVWAWGTNESGQIGNGTTGGTVATPVQVSGLGPNSGVISVAAGQAHSLALKSDGSVWAWGANNYGSLGNGLMNGLSNVPAQVSGLGPNSEITAIAAGNFHNLAVKSDGTIWAWGANGDGRLGDGSTSDRAVPVQVSQASGLVSNPGGIAVSAGSYHSLALTSDGSIWAWGNNSYGQLGNSNSTNSLTPDHVMQGWSNGVEGLTAAIAVSAGNYHSLAIRSDGSVWTWGKNGLNQLGDSTSTDRYSPVRVSGANLSSGAVMVAGGENCSLAVKSDGSVWAWGNYTASPTSFPSTTVHATDTGTITSLTLDAGSKVSWNNIFWNSRTPSSTTIKFRTRGSSTLEALTALDPAAGWSDYYTVSGSPVFTPNSRVLEVQLALQSYGSFTPTLDDFSVAYDVEQADTANPQSTVTTPAAGVITSAGSPFNISGTATDDVAVLGIEVSVNGGTTWQPAICSGCPGDDVTWTYAWTLPSDGSYTIRSRATDKSSKIETPGAGNAIILDRYAPVGLANSAPANTATGLSISTSVTAVAATDSGSSPVQYWFQLATNSGFSTGLQESTWQEGTSFTPTLASNTTYYWRVKARDASGNETAYTSAWSFRTMLPTAVWSTKGDFENNASTSGTATTRSLVQISGANSADDATASLKQMKFATISNGQYHTLAIKSDGSVWAWGTNNNGELGNGTSCYGCVNSTPVQVSGFGPGSGVISIAAGYDHSLAVKSDGSVWAWGNNTYYQLGDGTTNYSPIPVQIAAANSGFVAAAAGTNYSLAFKSDGSLWSWGRNAYGELGSGSTGSRPTPAQVSGMSPGSGVVAIAAGYGHSLAVKSNGSVWAWGNNGYGQVGNGSSGSNVLSPVQVTGTDMSTGAIAVSAGYDHSLAVKSDGSVWAWGHNNSGQLGNGYATDSLSPIKIIDTSSGAMAVTAGYSYSLALLSNGTVYAWGLNDKGQLGNNSTEQSFSPLQASGLTNAISVSAGYTHSTALKSDGTLATWGSNSTGQLGNGATSGGRPTPFQVTGLDENQDIKAIAAGGTFSLAVKGDGTVWGWGNNDSGQLGDNSTTQSAVPVQVAGLPPIDSITAGRLPNGPFGGFSLALDPFGNLFAWGSNGAGQFGNGTTDSSLVPVMVTPFAPGPLQAVSAGSGFALALDSFRFAWAWGKNSSGQLGVDPATTPAGYSSSPIQILALGPGVQSVSAGYNHSLAVDAVGAVWAWGDNSNGQLGVNPGDYPTSYTPIAVSGPDLSTGAVAVAAGTKPGGLSFSLALKADGSVWGFGSGYGATPVQIFAPGSEITKIAAGGGFSLALKNDGTLWAWGDNTDGQLGDGTKTSSATPVQVQGGLTGVSGIAAGFFHSLAFTTDGAAFAWGDNNLGPGQLGYDTSNPDIIIPTLNLVSGVKDPLSYPPSGIVTNLRNNLCQRSNWGTLSWNGTTPANTAIQFRTREADTEAGLASASWSAPYTTSGTAITSSSSLWSEIGLTLLSSDGTSTPTINDFTITCAP